jgi:hypothetical protein
LKTVDLTIDLWIQTMEISFAKILIEIQLLKLTQFARNMVKDGFSSINIHYSRLPIR